MLGLQVHATMLAQRTVVLNTTTLEFKIRGSFSNMYGDVKFATLPMHSVR